MTADEAVRMIQSGHRVYLHEAAMAPLELMDALVRRAPELRDVVPLVLHHQERYDGTGYPFRLKAEEIPLGARIIAAADAYHAIRSDRPYRSGRTHAEAVPEMLRCAGTQFDPKVINALLRALEADDNLRSMMISPLPAAPSSALASDSTGALN